MRGLTEDQQEAIDALRTELHRTIMCPDEITLLRVYAADLLELLDELVPEPNERSETSDD